MRLNVFNSLACRIHCALVIAGLIWAAGCTAPAPAAKFVVQAEAFHRGALASTIVADTDLNDYLQEVGSRIADAAHAAEPSKVNEQFILAVKCHLVNSDTINAFSTGGSHIYVTTALFQQCQNEEQLATAISHAYAHLINLDLEASRMRPDPRMPLTMVAWNFVLNRFTQRQEQQADLLALRSFSQAGWDPNRFPTLFEHLETVSGGNVAPDRQPLPIRAGALQGQAADMKRPPRRLSVADPRTFLMLRTRVAQFHEPAVPTVPQIFVTAFPNCLLSGDTPAQHEAQERLRPIPPPQVQKLEPN